MLTVTFALETPNDMSTVRNTYTSNMNSSFHAASTAVVCPGCNRSAQAEQLEPSCDCCCEARCQAQAGACYAAHAATLHGSQPLASSAWSRLAAFFLPKGHATPVRS